METTPPIPLALSLNPVLALRAPDTCTPIRTLGFQLRLPDGPALASDDPLLRVFGASVVAVIAGPDVTRRRRPSRRGSRPVSGSRRSC